MLRSIISLKLKSITRDTFRETQIYMQQAARKYKIQSQNLYKLT